MSAPITVVLVHGAFAESSSWTGVLGRLRDAGVHAVAIPNQLRGVSADADNVRSFVDSVDGPVLLVGHSYGGSVITEAASGTTSVTGLIYVSAFAPEHGEDALELTGRFAGSTLGETIRPVALSDGSNDLFVDRELFPAQFAGDVAIEDAQISAATQRPIRDAALTEALATETPAWKSIPSWFVFGSGDRNIPVDGLRFMADRAGSRRTVEIEGASHSIMVSHPDAVTELITGAIAELADAEQNGGRRLVTEPA